MPAWYSIRLLLSSGVGILNEISNIFREKNPFFDSTSIINLFMPSVHYPYQCWGYFRPKHKDANIFENHLNPVILVLIGSHLLNTLWRVPMLQSFSHFSSFLHHFVLAKLATSSIRVKEGLTLTVLLLIIIIIIVILLLLPILLLRSPSS